MGQPVGSTHGLTGRPVGYLRGPLAPYPVPSESCLPARDLPARDVTPRRALPAPQRRQRRKLAVTGGIEPPARPSPRPPGVTLGALRHAPTNFQFSRFPAPTRPAERVGGDVALMSRCFSSSRAVRDNLRRVSGIIMERNASVTPALRSMMP